MSLTNPTLVLAPQDGNVNNLSVTTSSSAAQDLAPGGGLVWVHFFFVGAAGDVCYLNFDGTSSVADATTTDVPVPAGVYVPFQVKDKTSHFKAIGSAAGTLIWFKTGS